NLSRRRPIRIPDVSFRIRPGIMRRTSGGWQRVHADLFRLGVELAETITGHLGPPHAAPTFHDSMRQRASLVWMRRHPFLRSLREVRVARIDANDTAVLQSRHPD